MYVYSMDGGTFRGRLSREGLNADEFCDPGVPVVTIHNVHFPPPLNHLAEYLVESGWLESVTPA